MASQKRPQVCDIAGGLCCGCGACVAICPRSCFEMLPDDTGFFRPRFNGASCVSCGRCDTVCPVINKGKVMRPVEVLWAKSRSRELLDASSSGGVFGLLARKVIDDGGLVVGASFSNNCRAVLHEAVDSKEGLRRLQRAKYVQSMVSQDVYYKIKKALVDGRRVLCAGTACQVAGIRNYLGRLADSALFLSVDVICHGTPSPLLWKKWVDYRAAVAQAEIDEVNFRSKTTGWLSFSVLYCVRTEKDKKCILGGRYIDDWYMRAFLNNASLRSSCYNCPSKLSCGSDITLGDFWGFPAIHPEVDSSAGVSAVLCNSEKGRCLVHDIVEQLESGFATYEEILAGNPALETSVVPHSQRAAFMKDLASGTPIEKMVSKWRFHDSLWLKIKRNIKRFLNKFKILLSRYCS